MILYSLIANGKIVLCDTDSPSRSAKEITGQILAKLESERESKDPTKMSFIHESYVFHIIQEGDMVYLCIATEDFGRRKPFAFLEEMKTRFIETVGLGNALQCKKKHKYDRIFGQTLAKQMTYYSKDPEADAVYKLKLEVEGTKLIIQNNVDHIIKIDQDISDLATKASSLETSAKEVRDTAKAIKDFYWWQNAKYYLMIALLLGGFAWFIAAKACGGFSFPECRSQEPPPDEEEAPVVKPHKKVTPVPPHKTHAPGVKMQSDMLLDLRERRKSLENENAQSTLEMSIQQQQQTASAA